MPEEFRDTPSGELDIAGGTYIDPIASGASAPSEPGTGKKRRGRPPGSGKSGSASGPAKTSEKVKLDLSSLTGMFVGVHLMLAHATGRAEWAISPDEGKQFMDRAQAVMRHYSVTSTQKTLDWIAFGGTAIGIYAPRIVAIAANKRNERQPNPQTVHQPSQHEAHSDPAYHGPSVVQGDFHEDAAE